MPSGINYNNKDILFKVLSQHYQNKSLAVYGLDLPRIKQLLPSSYPVVTATETHADTVFLLEDEISVLILEYESSPKMTDFLKYSKYMVSSLERLYSEGHKDEVQQVFTMAGILTATDKFIDRAYSDNVKEWIKMTKVARLFEEEKIEAVNESIKKERTKIALTMLANGEELIKIMKYTMLTRDEIEALLSSISA